MSEDRNSRPRQGSNVDRPGGKALPTQEEASWAIRRWRLVLGGGEEADGTDVELGRDDLKRDKALADLYDAGREGGLARSAPRVARWLDDIRGFFPQQVVQVLQRDAVERLGLGELLLEPELLAAVQPDVHLAAMLVALNRAIPERSRESARAVIRTVVTDLERRLASPARQAVGGALHRAARTRRPRPGDVDWPRTILANLRHWQPEQHTLVPEKLVGFGRRGPQVQRDLVLAIDQSASMGPSVVYASVFAAALASVRALRTRVVAFATEVVDLTDRLADPVELLFGVQLGGGTDIARALRYCAGVVERPRETILVLISDLYEGGDAADLLRQAGSLAASGVTVVALLALADDGAPAYDHRLAAAFAGLGIPAFACTPDAFPGLLAAAIRRDDLALWAAREGIVTAAPYAAAR